MKITTIGRGTIGGTLARLWTEAGHDVTELGRQGGDATGAEAVLLAVPSDAVPDALTRVTGLGRTVVIDATNRFGDMAAPPGHASVAEYVRATTGSPTAKAFNLNFGNLYDRAASASRRPDNLWVGDEEARAVVEQLSSDIGMRAIHGGPLHRAATQEAYADMLMSIVADLGGGLLFYRFDVPSAL